MPRYAFCCNVSLRALQELLWLCLSTRVGHNPLLPLRGSQLPCKQRCNFRRINRGKTCPRFTRSNKDMPFGYINADSYSAYEYIFSIYINDLGATYRRVIMPTQPVETRLCRQSINVIKAAGSRLCEREWPLSTRQCTTSTFAQRWSNALLSAFCAS